MNAHWNTWSPFQSREVRDICTHMTDAEAAEASRRAGFYGLWVAATLAIPLGVAISGHSLLFTVIAVLLITVHVFCIPIWQKMQRRFLCSTAWAREHGITSDRLKMFAFRA
jgi:hypothetical protein